MTKKRIMANISEEAFNRLDSMAIADNCHPDDIIEHLLMGRMLVENGVGTVPEDGRIACLMIRPKGERAYLYCSDPSEIHDHFLAGREGDEWEMTWKLMTPQEMAALPEFDGW